jgi:ADP-heptose:LPS heptosyltransferase/glycosyltransferase involved in cell wall biosynthesis
MKKILLVGEHPYSTTGNGNMMKAILEQIDMEKYQVTVYCHTKADLPPYEKASYSIIDAEITEEDDFGVKKLGNVIGSLEYDVLLTIGVDIWRYAQVFGHIAKVRRHRGFRFGMLFPYDIIMPREDWINWIRMADFPCVYSKFGYDLLKPYVPKIRYYRPTLHGHELFEPYDPERRRAVRAELFPTLGPDSILMGFIGPNQFRKDPQRLLKVYMYVKRQIPNLFIYMHTRFTQGVFNLQQLAMDYGAGPGDIIVMNQRSAYTREKMPDIYNAMDFYINPSLQEGLSWTVVEAQLCGVPVVISKTTAHHELICDGGGHGVECTDLAYIPVVSQRGPSWVETSACNQKSLADAILRLSTDMDYRAELREKGLECAREWVAGMDDINELLGEMSEPLELGKAQAVLFVQHSSAGDVLMSTQCFKGLKERHDGIPFHYMTQQEYQDIVEDNPYVDKIVDYDEDIIGTYEIVYNPHGDRILPGGFNNLDTRLHSMYPYFCKVEEGDMFIDLVEPEVELPEEYIVVHTTGGHKQYRGYKHMDTAVKGLGYDIVQVGGGDDLACKIATLDLRGKLTWRETAWVMKNAKVAVVIDSYPSHLAGALGTPVVVIYGPAPARVTGPRGDEEKIINLEPNKLDVCPNLTNCWGSPGERKCTTPCINTVNPMTVRKSVKKLLQPPEAFGR